MLETEQFDIIRVRCFENSMNEWMTQFGRILCWRRVFLRSPTGLVLLAIKRYSNHFQTSRHLLLRD
jgi:hypothetical protein